MFQFERNALAKFLEAVTFPVSREKLIEQAAGKDIPHQVIALLQRLPQRDYKNAEEVNSELAVKV